MKSTIFNLSILFGLLICSQSVFAQYDDVYYDPSKFQEDHYKFEKKSYPPQNDPVQEEESDASQNKSLTQDADEEDYDDEDYDYYYSSRIKRFHNPYRGFDFYDPAYVNVYFYDPFYLCKLRRLS